MSGQFAVYREENLSELIFTHSRQSVHRSEQEGWAAWQQTHSVQHPQAQSCCKGLARIDLSFGEQKAAGPITPGQRTRINELGERDTVKCRTYYAMTKIVSKFLRMLGRMTGLTNNKLGFPCSCLALSWQTVHAQNNHIQAQQRRKLRERGKKNNVWSEDTQLVFQEKLSRTRNKLVTPETLKSTRSKTYLMTFTKILHIPQKGKEEEKQEHI